MVLTDNFSWLESVNREQILTAAEIRKHGMRIVSREAALLPLEEEKDAAAEWLEQNDPEKGGTKGGTE